MMVFLRMFSGCVLQLSPFALLCFYPFKEHTRFSKKKTLIITVSLIAALGLIFAVICLYLKSVYPREPAIFYYANGVFMCCLVPCFGWYLYAIKEIWQKKLFIFMFTVTGALAMTSIGTIIETKLQLVQDTDGLPYFGSTLLTLTILTVIALPLFWLLLKRCYLPVSDVLSRKESGSLSLLAFLLFVVLASGLVPLSYDDIYNPASLALYITLLASVFVIYAVCFKMLFHAHDKLIAQQHMAQMQHQMEIRDEQYKRITDNIESSRKLRHDMRHHAIALQGYLSAGELQKAEGYLSRFMTTLDEHELEKLCDNTIVNTVVGYYKANAMEKGIDFTIRISMPKEITVQDSDMAVLLGNLLENAITAAQYAERDHKTIALNIIRSGQMLAITVDNSFDGNIKMEYGKYLSLKSQHVGVGLGSIESIAVKYGGGVEFSHEGTCFHASVMLNLK
ncbi:MAG: ATP-binding protein [Christensenellaceae bacterium]